MLQNVLNIIAVLLIIYGFSIVHQPKPIMEIAGSICVGIGALYFVVKILLHPKKETEED